MNQAQLWIAIRSENNEERYWSSNSLRTRVEEPVDVVSAASSATEARLLHLLDLLHPQRGVHALLPGPVLVRLRLLLRRGAALPAFRHARDALRLAPPRRGEAFGPALVHVRHEDLRVRVHLGGDGRDGGRRRRGGLLPWRGGRWGGGGGVAWEPCGLPRVVPLVVAGGSGTGRRRAAVGGEAAEAG